MRPSSVGVAAIDAWAPLPVAADRPARVVTAAQVARAIPDGAHVAFGGSGLARKSMVLARALAHAGRRGLHVWTGVGGLEVETLLAAQAVDTVHATFVGLEALGLGPLFRRGRERGTFRFDEWSEWTLIAAVRAGAEGAPFAPVRAALGSDVARLHPEWRAMASPFDQEPLLALAPVRVDVAVLHVDAATEDGRAYVFGDAHSDRLWAASARTVFVSAERLRPADWEPADGFLAPVAFGPAVAGVIEAPGGARPGAAAPWYRADSEAVRAFLHGLTEVRV